MTLDELVALSVKHNASDLHLCPGREPLLRRDGELFCPEPLALLTGETIADLCEPYLDARRRAELAARGQADCAITLMTGYRLRGHFFRQREGMAAAFRLVPAGCPTPKALEMPPAIVDLLGQPHGLLLLAGATGSGKSSSLAALVDHLNRHRRMHIITLEDPIEYIHAPGLGLIQQREVGEHCADFGDGLRGALRQDPDAIVLGELRDADTIHLALAAAETGHLVLATLHAGHAAQAVERLIDHFSAQRQGVARASLAGVLLAVLAQKLVPRPGGGRKAHFQLLAATPAVRNLIREGKTHLLAGMASAANSQD